MNKEIWDMLTFKTEISVKGTNRVPEIGASYTFSRLMISCSRFASPEDSPSWLAACNGPVKRVHAKKIMATMANPERFGE